MSQFQSLDLAKPVLGTLIAPGWVLTAAHCVAHVRSADSASVGCGGVGKTVGGLLVGPKHRKWSKKGL